ncbi:hypothetical protein [Rhodoferax fermentans]|nr:hypothetical protein [Rhodoferax fermentans]
MKQLILALGALISCTSGSAAAPEQSARAAELIAAGAPGVRWDRGTLVEGDFNGDGKPDFAVVGYKGDGLVLAIRASSAKGGRYRTDYQHFGISPSIQAAICEAPAKLGVGEQVCRPMDEQLPGCRPSNTTKSLHLSGGDCDAIHLFWNHKTNLMEWWRL